MSAMEFLAIAAHQILRITPALQQFILPMSPELHEHVAVKGPLLDA